MAQVDEIYISEGKETVRQLAAWIKRHGKKWAEQAKYWTKHKETNKTRFYSHYYNPMR